MFKKKSQYPDSGTKDDAAFEKQSLKTSTVKIKEQKRNKAQEKEEKIRLELQIENLKIQHEHDILAKDRCNEEQKCEMKTIIENLKNELEIERKEKLASFNAYNQLKEETQKVQTDVLLLQNDTLAAQIENTKLRRDLENEIKDIEKEMILLKEEVKVMKTLRSQKMQNFKAVLQTKNKELQENLQVLETCKSDALATNADFAEINRLQILQNTAYISNLGKLICDVVDI